MKQFMSKKHILLILALACSLCLLTGCSKDPKNFTVNQLTITLTEEFEVQENKIFDIYIESNDVGFSAVEETAESLEYAGYEISSLKDYCMEILELNNTPTSELKQRGNYYYFVNSSVKSGASYTYVHCMMEGFNSYWICEFACKTKFYDKYEDDIFKWADSIVITSQ